MIRYKKIVSMMAIFICVTGVFFLFQCITSPAKDIRDQENSVQLVSNQMKMESKKNVPDIYNGKVRKVAYLTFDDGPGKYTSELLNILKENDVKATFFLIGPNIHQYVKEVKRESMEGHYVGMHSMTHNYKPLYKENKYVIEMKETQKVIENIIDYKPTLTRPPYGSTGFTENISNQIVENQLKVWDWTIDSFDWKFTKLPLEQSVPQIVNNVVSKATQNREVILLHDIHQQSVKAVPFIIKGLKEKGYEFEPYSESSHFPLNFWHDSRL
ncbi:polysaccharide deacetylase [Bacillus cereus]|nr:polysaccharide deacetylase [Bacillus cereus]